MAADQNPSSSSAAEQAAPKPPTKDPKKKKDEKKEEDLSDEDLELKRRLEEYVESVQHSDPGVQKLALEMMRQEIRTSTSSMTSVPKPLKFLRPHYGTLKAYFETMAESDLKKYLADILSVLALTMSAEGERESLKYRLLGSEGDIGSWGHEYVRNLAGEISQEFAKHQYDDMPIDALMELVQQIVAFHMKHNAEPEAVDLLMEVEDLDLLVEHVDKTNYKRTCLYLISSSSFLPSQDDMLALATMFEAFWHRMGDEATIVIPGWQTMSYFSDVTNMCWFLEPEFNQEVRRLHKLVGNAVTEDRYIIVGTGATQLFQAAVYALSPSDASEPMSVVSSVPYYSSYPMMTDYLRSELFRWAGDANAFRGGCYIEVICSPNNPDGFMNKAVLNSEPGKTIHDLAYYWPQYTAITEPVDHDIMLFTVSKCTGHAGTRLGWAIVKDPNVAKKMTKFVEMNTIGVSKDSQLRAAKIVKVISDGYELPNTDSSVKLFDYGRRHLAERWERLREVVKDIGIFSLPEYTSETCKFTGERIAIYPAFAWLKCEKEGIEDTESFLKTLKILSRNGKHFGVEAKYVRVSMLDREETFNLFIDRLTSLK